MNSKLSRDFTRNEKILLLILSCFLLVMLYFYAVDRPIRTELATVQAETEELEVEKTVLTAEAEHMRSMSEELDETKNSPYMPSYNGIKKETEFLNDVLKSAYPYNMTLKFDDVTRSGNQIRRNVHITFTTPDYKTAVQIVRELSESPYRCLLGDVQFTPEGNRHADDLTAGEVDVSLAMTFYETMEGGTPDAGLPETEDKVEGNSDSIDEYLDEYYSSGSN